MTSDDAREYVERWRKAGPALARVQAGELRAFIHAENAIAVDDLLAAGLIHAQPRVSSGLVEMQRIFSRTGK